ncbi:hypothetical protein V7S43_004592 [Phytophthora oleae]|uniref:Uncharacterized protein n=1 Tax=Phytophthora oleae TaxID=2107226 RepID=A0ABD3FZ98_9STRA
MSRLGAIFALMLLLTNLVFISAFDWTFWSDDDDSESASGSASLSVETEAPTTMATSSSTVGSSIDSSSAKMNYSLARVSEVESTISSTYRNWVGPHTLSADSACYREAHIMDTCPSNFNRSNATDTCWTQCPIEYPVGVVANSALSIASLGVSKELWTIAKGVKTAVNCANSMIGTVRAIIRYIRNIKTSDPQASQDKMLALLYQTNNVVTDLPMAIYACMGLDVPTSLDISGRVLTTFEWILINLMAYDDDIVSSWDKFKAFLTEANFTEVASSINDTEIAILSDALASNSTCGFDLKSLTDRTWMTIAQLRKDNPDITEDELRLKIEDSELVVSDIGIVTNNCMQQLIKESDEATAYQTRDKIRKAFSGMINDLISTETSNNGLPNLQRSSRTKLSTRASHRLLSLALISLVSREC